MSDETNSQIPADLGGRHAAGAPTGMPENEMTDREPPSGPDLPGQPGGPSQPGTPSPEPPSTPGGPGETPQEPNPPSPAEPTVPTPQEPQFSREHDQSADAGAQTESGDDADRFVRGDGSQSDLGVLARDAAHPFDQTNGIIDGLNGDADDPERVEERLDAGSDRGPGLPPVPGAEPDDGGRVEP
jgi:hypothetical protein